MIEYTPTGFVNDAPPALSAAELNKIGNALKALVDGDADHTIAILKLASVLAQDGKLNPDIIDDGSIEGDKLADTYPRIFFGSKAPTETTFGKLNDFYVHTYSLEGSTYRDIYICYDPTLDHRVWRKVLALEDADLRYMKLSTYKTAAEIEALPEGQMFSAQGGSAQAIKTTTGYKQFVMGTKVNTIDNSPTNEQVPTAKAAADYTDSSIDAARPRIVTGISLPPSSWNNNQQEIMLPAGANITANTKADIDIGESSYEILKNAGVERIWTENDGDPTNPTLTAHIIGTPPDETIYIQLTLTEVNV